MPEEVLLAVEAAAQASARKQSASRRRSLSRTPGTKIVIIEQTTPASARAASGAKRPTAEVRRLPFGQLPRLLAMAEACLRAYACFLASAGLILPRVLGCVRVQAACQATPRLLSTIAVQTEAEDCGDDVEQERSDEGGSVEDDSLELEGGRAPCPPHASAGPLAGPCLAKC